MLTDDVTHSQNIDDLHKLRRLDTKESELVPTFCTVDNRRYAIKWREVQE